MKTFEVVAKILSVSSLNHSVYGNPKHEVGFQDENGEYFRGKTATDAACAYGIGNYSVGQKYKLTYHFTRKGNLIIDFATKLD